MQRTDQEILNNLESQLTFDDWLALKRGLALLDEAEPPTLRATLPVELYRDPTDDPQKMTVEAWPVNDEVSR